jgi:putative transport protein
VFGRRGRIGRLVTSVPHSAASVLSTFGVLMFLSCTGIRAGAAFVSAVTSTTGVRCLAAGAAVTLLACVGLSLVGRLHRIQPARLSGMLAGAQTQTAVLVAANERTAFDAQVAVGYALLYPVAVVVRCDPADGDLPSRHRPGGR